MLIHFYIFKKIRTKFFNYLFFITHNFNVNKKSSFLLSPPNLEFNYFPFILKKKFFNFFFKSVFFFSYFDIDKFNFTYFHNFKFTEFFHSDRFFSFFSSRRSFFFNYSLPYNIAISKFKFFSKDFDLFVFSDCSIIFGNFSLLNISDKNNIYPVKYYFCFSLTDFSITLFIEFSDFSSPLCVEKFIYPVSFYIFSKADYNILIFLFKHFSSDINFSFNVLFSSFFSSIFSNIFIPFLKNNEIESNFSKNVGVYNISGNFQYFFLRNFIFSNFDSHPYYFKFTNYKFDYYKFDYLKKQFFDFNEEEFFPFQAFIFFKKLLSIFAAWRNW